MSWAGPEDDCTWWVDKKKSWIEQIGHVWEGARFEPLSLVPERLDNMTSPELHDGILNRGSKPIWESIRSKYLASKITANIDTPVMEGFHLQCSKRFGVGFIVPTKDVFAHSLLNVNLVNLLFSKTWVPQGAAYSSNGLIYTPCRQWVVPRSSDLQPWVYEA